jgi:hypothetical protein
MRFNGDSADELAAQLSISPKAISEAIRRGFLRFEKRRRVACWWFGDARNGCWRRLDGLPFEIKGQRVKAEAETRGDAWHRLIGLDDVMENDRREILLVTEGSKDALAALHFADAEGTLTSVGVVAALGSGVTLCPDDIEKFRGRRVRIFGDTDTAGRDAVARVANQLLATADEVQIFSLSDLHCRDGALIKDLFDLTLIDSDDFEVNRDLLALTDLNSKGDRVSTAIKEHEFSFSPSPLPHVSPESHGYLVYPVSNCQDLGEELEELALRNACTKRDTGRRRRWQLERDLKAVGKRIARELNPEELIPTFEKWYSLSRPHLDPKKNHDDYLGKFLGELGKVRVPTGEGEALRKALEHVSTLPVPALPVPPGIAEAPESWRRLAALHRQLARQSANGTYFLSCRHAAKVHPSLNKDNALTVNRALEQLRVIKCERVGDPRPGGKASEFRYLLPLNSGMGATDLPRLNGKAA